jgi:hypothetical protein
VAVKNSSFPLPKRGAQKPVASNFDFEDLITATVVSITLKRPLKRKTTYRRDYQG